MHQPRLEIGESLRVRLQQFFIMSRPSSTKGFQDDTAVLQWRIDVAQQRGGRKLGGIYISLFCYSCMKRSSSQCCVGEGCSLRQRRLAARSKLHPWQADRLEDTGAVWLVQSG
jgi:hypothetical protein